MQFPIINVNGTDCLTLMNGYSEAKRRAVELLNQLGEIWPHGRDYQNHYNPKAGLQHATSEHAQRILMVRRLIVELDMLAESVSK